eukprot:1642962-Pleurochrysis_carterae.AAC.1
MQALRSGALELLPLPAPWCSRLHPVVRSLVAPHGRHTEELSPPRATNNQKGGKKPADFSSVSRALHGTRTLSHFESALLACN